MGENDSTEGMPPFARGLCRAASAENLKAVASRTAEADLLLGLAFVARPRDPVRRELCNLAAQAKPEYAAIAAVLAVTMDGVDEASVDELIRKDPDNALGHYLRADRLHAAGRDEEALEGFRKGASSPELRLYESITGEALFKAFDVLEVQGRDRLLALADAASRASNFACIALQPLQRSMTELARSASNETRKEIADLLLVLAGQLYLTNFRNRWYAHRALESAFQLKAEVGAAEHWPTATGYAAVVQAMTRHMVSWRGFERQTKPEDLAHFLPDRIARAFAVAEPSTANKLIEMQSNPPDSDRPRFEKAREKAARTAEALIEAALKDMDVLLGAYLKGLRKREPGAAGLGPNFWTPVESVLGKMPEVLVAADAHDQAMRELWEAGESDPRRRNVGNLMKIGWEVLGYAQKHEGNFPESLGVVLDQGHLKPPLEPRSLLTGRPYIYVAAGEKQPSRSTDAAQFVVLYDDQLSEGECYDCFTAMGACGGLRKAQLEEQLRKRGLTINLREQS